MFPVIKQLADLLPHIKDNEFIRVKEEPNGMTVVCYMLQDDETFEGASAAHERECRGITFGPDGKIAARTLHKFFNIGEREDTQPHSIPWAQVVRIMDKRDGSMVTPVLRTLPNVPIEAISTIVWKTKKSFETKEATLAAQVAALTPNGHDWIVAVLRAGFTPTFEITSPKFPIVLKYDRDELTLLHVRENMTGRYLSEDELQQLNSPFPIVENLIDQFYGEGLPAKLVSWEKLKAAAEVREGIEGWIVQLSTGEMFKVKTKWYCDLHRTIVFLRERDVARLALDDKIDDLIGQFALVDKDPAPVRRINKIVLADLAELQAEVEAEHAKLVGKTKKEAALATKDHRLFGLIMRAMDGKEIDVREWYNRHVLEHKFSLAVIDTGEQLLDGDI